MRSKASGRDVEHWYFRPAGVIVSPLYFAFSVLHCGLSHVDEVVPCPLAREMTSRTVRRVAPIAVETVSVLCLVPCSYPSTEFARKSLGRNCPWSASCYSPCVSACVC